MKTRQKHRSKEEKLSILKEAIRAFIILISAD